MTNDYEIGYGRPPKHSRFKKGVCANPLGRGRKDSNQYSDILNDVLNAKLVYTEAGKRKTGTRIELIIKKLSAAAVNGDVASAEALLKIRENAKRYGAPGPTVVRVINALPNDLPTYEKVLD